MTRNSAWALASSSVSAVAIFAETVILAHYLSPHDLGTFLLILAYPNAVQQLLDFRVRDGMTRYLPDFLTRDDKDAAVATIKLVWLLDVSVSAAAFLIVAATAGVAAAALVNGSSSAGLMIVFAGGLFFGSLDSASGTALRALERFALSFGVGAASALGRLALVGGVAVLGGGITELVWARAGAELLTTLTQGTASVIVLVGLLWDHRHSPLNKLKPYQREIRRFLLSTNVAGMIRLASSTLDTILVGILSGPSTVAIYQIAIRFGRVPVLAADALSSVVFPAFVREMVHGRVQRIRRIALRSSMLLTAPAIPVGLALALNADSVIGFLAGDAYRAAGPGFALCLIGVVPFLVTYWATPLILTADHAPALVVFTAVSTAVQFVCIATLVPAFGASGAAAGTGALYLTGVLMQVGFVWRRKLLGGSGPAVTAPAAGG
ncbi:MAG: lipopolysaccharide biosynthesis protein [Chloroflexota bacterium]|nr:lipopolysaccharide biosynthesis protein [Chloroflexota bacterium]